MFGGAMGIPPPGMPGLPPVNAFPPQFPSMMTAPPMGIRPPMGPQGVMSGVGMPPAPPLTPNWGPLRPGSLPTISNPGNMPPQRGPLQ